MPPVYRDQFHQCPACRAELEQARSVWRCSACKGCWVEERILAEMIQNMQDGLDSDPVVFTPRAKRDPIRPCPMCGEGMAHVDLEGVELDRCAAHGIWFDERELQAALYEAGRHRPKRVNRASPELRPSVDKRHEFWAIFWNDLE